MERRFVSAILIILTAALCRLPSDAGASQSARARTLTVKGRISFLTGPKQTVTAEVRAKVWVFQGREDLALRSLEKLRQFEVQFPQGLTRVEDRPKEDETRMSAIVLMTYSTVHQPSLLSTVPLDADGSFQFAWDGKNPVTVIVESAATMGSYHMPRYAVRVLDPKQPLKPLLFDFGVSHLESHPAATAGDAGVKG